MIRTELRKWDKYEKKSEWKEFINSLSKEDYSIYQSYQGHRGNIVKVENKMNKLNNQLKELKETQNEYYKRLTKVNSKIDHLRKEFNITPNVSYWKKPIRRDSDGNRIVDKNEYFNGKIGRSGYKSFGLNLGNIKTVKQRLLDYYKGNSYQLNRIRKFSKDRKTYKDLVNGFISSNESKTIIRNEIRMNPKMKSLKKPLDVLFPLK
jgi:DNA repair exonuclease SbcCD ATPase subunit